MLERHDQFWSQFFGVSSSDLNRVGVSIVAHAGLDTYRGVWFFQHQDRLIVSAPEGWLAHLKKFENALESDLVIDGPFLQALFGDHLERIIGPVFQGSLVPGDFRPVVSSDVCPLTDQDAVARTVFQSECGLEAWRDSGLDEAKHVVGFWHHGRIMAMAGYRAWSNDAGDPCVLTHPDHLSRGLGSLVVSEVIRSALLEGKILLYQTLESNLAAVRLARKLGYRQYAWHVAVRLTSHLH
jgi:GNAT superfamily N-acetyltransferase